MLVESSGGRAAADQVAPAGLGGAMVQRSISDGGGRKGDVVRVLS